MEVSDKWQFLATSKQRGQMPAQNAGGQAGRQAGRQARAAGQGQGRLAGAGKWRE